MRSAQDQAITRYAQQDLAVLNRQQDRIRRLSMIGSGVFAAYEILVGIGAGIVIAVIAMIAVAVRKEDKQFSLSGAAPGPVTSGVRRLTGFGSIGTHYRPRTEQAAPLRIAGDGRPASVSR
jgi:hypothetical protein